jgi:hypothetical protein
MSSTRRATRTSSQQVANTVVAQHNQQSDSPLDEHTSSTTHEETAVADMEHDASHHSFSTPVRTGTRSTHTSTSREEKRIVLHQANTGTNTNVTPALHQQTQSRGNIPDTPIVPLSSKELDTLRSMRGTIV